MLIDDTDACSFYDDSIGQREAKRLQRPRKAGFDFVQEGRFSRMAELQRIRVSTALDCFISKSICKDPVLPRHKEGNIRGSG